METISTEIEDQKKRLSHIERMTKCFQDKPKETQSKGYAQTMLEDLEFSFKSFKDGHDSIMDFIKESSMKESDVPYLNSDTYYNCYDKYISLKSLLLDLLFEFESPHNSSVHASTFASHNARQESFAVNARLPKIDLPTFSGDYLDWIAYRDMFLSLVHNNNSLTNVQKYYFLKSSCTGTPLSMINEYPIADSSYELAWDALQKRFHNTRKLVEQILKRLFSIPFSNGTCTSVKELLDTTRNCLAQLKALNIDTSTWDCILVYMTTQKLNVPIRKEWEKSLQATTYIPEMTKMLAFLETTFRTLECVEEDVLPHSDWNRSKQRVFPKESIKVQSRSIRAHTAIVKHDDNCPCCNKRHLLYKCFRFLSLPSAEKKNLINQKRLCRNCLNAGHLQSSCRLAARCQICQEPHHTTVHQEFSNESSPSLTTQNNSTNRNYVAPNSTSTPQTPTVSTNLSYNESKQLVAALLPTVRVSIKSQNRIFCIKALLDQGSQLSFISEDLAQLLHVSKHKTHVNVSGIGGVATLIAKKYVDLTIYSF